MKQKIEAIVLDFFKGDVLKAKQWMQTKNPLLGYLSPNDLINLGKARKLFRQVNCLLSEELP